MRHALSMLLAGGILAATLGARPDPIVRVVIPSKLGLGPPRKAEKMLVPTADADAKPKQTGPGRGRKRKLGRAP